MKKVFLILGLSLFAFASMSPNLPVHRVAVDSIQYG